MGRKSAPVRAGASLLVFLAVGIYRWEPENAMTSKSSDNPWIFHLRPNPQAQLQLFFFPHGGGSAQAFYSWKDEFPEEVALYAIQLPGRGARLKEPPMTRLTPLVQELGRVIGPYLEKPFAFFGHSIGALIAFELARELRKMSDHFPKQLFVSARHAPQIADPMSPIHHLSDAEFLKEIERYNGIPREILEEADLMQMTLPALRADLECVETYVYLEESPLVCPISCYGGRDDPTVSYEQLEAWREQTCASFSVKIFPGEHFFIQTHRSLFLRALTEELRYII